MSGCDLARACVSDGELLTARSSTPFLAGVKEGYERWAATYDHFPNPLLAREERHIVPLLSGLRNRNALDLACGTGRWLKRLLAAGARSGVGVDLSRAMLAVASAKHELAGKVLQADCLRLPFPASTFDFSICSFALGHIRNLRSAAAEFSRVMKPGSDLLVSELHPEAVAMGWHTGFRDHESRVQIETVPRSADAILEVFRWADCKCVACDSLFLGSPEQHLFAAAGKQHLFQAACSVPGILFCHFKRAAGATGNGRMS